jgi:hypothetical protein
LIERYTLIKQPRLLLLKRSPSDKFTQIDEIKQYLIYHTITTPTNPSYYI